ncbi:MAG: RNA polymerase sigma factor [Candidatus Limnocylindrales bacterium]
MTVPEDSSQLGLVGRAQRGDADAFARLVSSHLDSAWRFVRAIGGDRVDVDDVVQEAFVLVWRDLPRLRDPGSFEPWLRAVLVNATRHAIRRTHGVRLIPIAVAAEGSGPPGRAQTIRPEDVADGGVELGDSVAGRDRLRRAFGRLSIDERTVLALRYFEGYPVERIATIIERPIGTVKSRLHSARSALRVALAAEDR